MQAHEAGVPQHGGQQIIKIVRHARSQPANAFHVLGLPKLSFQQTPLADVSGRAGDANGLAALIPNRSAPGKYPFVFARLYFEPMLAG